MTRREMLEKAMAGDW